jgi:hypothetical protein
MPKCPKCEHEFVTPDETSEHVQSTLVIREIDRETRRARGTMAFQGCERCKNITRELGSLFLFSPDVLDQLKRHLIDLHGAAL